MSNKNLIYLAIAAIVIYFIVKANKASAKGLTEDNSNENSSGVPTKKVYTKDTVFGMGDRGDGVKVLQTTINAYLPSTYSKLATDGIFGQKTLTALNKFWRRSSASINQINQAGRTPEIMYYQPTNTGVFVAKANNFFNKYGVNF